jgi:hypothetical protein
MVASPSPSPSPPTLFPRTDSARFARLEGMYFQWFQTETADITELFLTHRRKTG